MDSNCKIKPGDWVKENGMGQPMQVKSCGTDAAICEWKVDGTTFKQAFLIGLLVKCNGPC